MFCLLLYKNQKMKQIESYHTIIVGAGLAGVSCADFIAKRKHNILILESQSYIGGRAKSTQIQLINNQKTIVDEGPSWLHNYSTRHPFSRLHKNLKKQIKLVQTVFEEAIYYDEKGKDTTKQTASSNQQLAAIMKKCYKYKDLTVLEAMQQVAPQKLKDPCFMHVLANEIQSQTSGSIKSLAAYEGQNDHYYGDNDKGEQMYVVGGYQNFAVNLAEHKKITVKLNHKVVQVERNQQSKMTLLKCSNGDVFQGEHVVFAVPLSVYKNKSIKFTPKLPKKKLKAAYNLCFGNLCKIFISLDDSKYFENSKQHVYGIISQDVQKRGLACTYINLKSVTGKPMMLTFGTGENALEAETMPEQQLKKLISSRLSLIFETQINPPNFTLFRTQWGQNPNYNGVFTYAGLETDGEDFEEIARPVFKNKWFFAGEHTYSWYRGTTHGAFNSGIDAAKSLLYRQEEDWYYWNEADKSDEDE